MIKSFLFKLGLWIANKLGLCHKKDFYEFTTAVKESNTKFHKDLTEWWDNVEAALKARNEFIDSHTEMLKRIEELISTGRNDINRNILDLYTIKTVLFKWGITDPDELDNIGKKVKGEDIPADIKDKIAKATKQRKPLELIKFDKLRGKHEEPN